MNWAQADYNFANDVMGLSQIKAPRGGMAIYSDRRDWEGRAVNVGDPILQVADPGQIALRIDLPAAEQMALENGSRVKVWLDAQPLWAIEGKVEHASYQARQTAEGILAFARDSQANVRQSAHWLARHGQALWRVGATHLFAAQASDCEL